MTNKPTGSAKTDESPKAVPQAVLKPQRRLSPAMLVPVAALLFAGWLGYTAWVSRGYIITVQLDQGHGIKTGHEVRYRGITVGEVRKVKLAEGFDGVIVTVSLATQADQLAHSGSRFWVVRPQLGLEGVQGLETLMGPRYLAVAPGLGALQRHFIGLNEPPVVETIEPGDLEIVLQATKRGGLRRGAPVTYRQVPVGAVLSVGLASDGGAVEARVHIGKAYAQL
ncbi:MAG: MCE family protein, partial [Planctomycetes bacterium]|nr:MCE family protein [Planctomycetota bacterium]